jgi:hypothetical protein
MTTRTLAVSPPPELEKPRQPASSPSPNPLSTQDVTMRPLTLRIQYRRLDFGRGWLIQQPLPLSIISLSFLTSYFFSKSTHNKYNVSARRRTKIHSLCSFDKSKYFVTDRHNELVLKNREIMKIPKSTFGPKLKKIGYE